MASIGLAKAARLTGRNQSTIHRAMKAGRLSFALSETGERRIDTAELDRVFGIKITSGNGASYATVAQSMQSKTAQGDETTALQRLLDDRECTIADLRETIRDLRGRLDAETEDRKRDAEERRQLMALLTSPARVPWWRRWFR
jgi:hypothetical protein